MTELKPCPFCGGKVKKNNIASDENSHVCLQKMLC